MESTGAVLAPFDSLWRLYSDPAHQRAFQVENSKEVLGTGNEVTDPRIACDKRPVLEVGSTNVDIQLTGSTGGVHESWNCASVAAFTAPGTLAGDHNWTIGADNFRVEVIDSTPLGSHAFGRVVSDVLPGGDATALDTHTAALPQTLSGTTAVRLQARFVFHALTTLGRGEARLGVEDSSSGVLYAVALNAHTSGSPVQLFAKSTNYTVDLGTAGDQTTSGVWQVDVTFRRVSSTSTEIDYLVTRPNGAPYAGTTTVSTAVGTSAAFDRVYLGFKQRGQVVFDSVQVMPGD